MENAMKHRSRLRLAIAGLGMAALTVPLFGCASASAGDPADQVLDYWVWQDDATDPTWTQMVEDFNANSTNGTVRLETIPLAQYEDKLLNALASGGGPDAARFRDLWLGEFVAADAVEPLTSYIDEWDGADDVVDQLWETGKVPGDDTVYMLPHQNATYYLYYRPSILSAAGLQPPKTHQDVLDIAAALKEEGQYALDVRGGAGGQDQWSAWMYSGGAEFIDDDGNPALAETGTEANEDYVSFVTNGEAPPGSITADFAAVKSNFFSGTTAMMLHHPGSLNAVREAVGEDYGVVQFPQADPANPVTFGIMSGQVILKGSDKKDLAWEWLSYLDSHDPMLKLSTSIQGQLPVLKSVIDEPQFADDADLAIALEAQGYARTWPLLPGASTLANKEWGPTLQSAFEGTISSEDALTRMGDVLTKD
jgi:multiple sugar transport system substrate-binding protein